MYDHELKKLQDKLQNAMLEVDRLQRWHRELTGRNFVISGPRPKIETREVIYVTYYPADRRDRYPESEIEFEGEGCGASAIADRLNLDPIRDELCVEYETAKAIEAEDIAADRADWEWEKRRPLPLHLANIRK